jgi:hypothetical protein
MHCQSAVHWVVARASMAAGQKVEVRQVTLAHKELALGLLNLSSKLCASGRAYPRACVHRTARHTVGATSANPGQAYERASAPLLWVAQVAGFSRQIAAEDCYSVW